MNDENTLMTIIENNNCKGRGMLTWHSRIRNRFPYDW